MTKAVIFDFDDTLFESRAQKWAQHTYVAKNFYDIDLKEEKIREHWGKPIHILANEIYESKEDWDNIYPKLVSTREKFPKNPYPESVEVINNLLKQGIKVGVVSAATKLDVYKDLEHHAFPVDEMILIQGADETEFHKPDPRVFDHVLKKLLELEIKPNEIVYVGDSLTDFQAALGADMNFIAVTTGLYSEKDFEKSGAKFIIRDLKELPDLLKKF